MENQKLYFIFEFKENNMIKFDILYIFLKYNNKLNDDKC